MKLRVGRGLHSKSLRESDVENMQTHVLFIKLLYFKYKMAVYSRVS